MLRVRIILIRLLTIMKKLNNRWIQLSLCVIVLIIISAPQYLWALFVRPLLTKFDVPLSELQVVFSLVVVCMTFITPLAGYFHDRFNSKNIIALGLLMCSGSWVLASYASSLLMLYISYGIIGGLGAGIAFIGATGLVQKCFPDKRGLATGILMSGYAFGPLLSTVAISNSVSSHGVEITLNNFGFVYILMGLLVVAGLRAVEQIDIPLITDKVEQEGVNAISMLTTPVFWVMFAMMTMIAASGMMVTSNIAIIAKEAGIGSNVVMFGLAALPLALMVDRITNGFSRIIFGSISDNIGRENTLSIAFFLEAVFVLAWFSQLHNPVMFVILSGLVFLAWGEIFSIFPALCTDTFGEKNASVNFGFLYASVGIGAIFGGPIAALLRETSGSWSLVFSIIVVLDLLTAFFALTLLKKMRISYKEKRYHTDVDIQDSGRLASATSALD